MPNPSGPKHPAPRPNDRPTGEEPFRAASAERPQDDLTRLVFADYLDDAGDPLKAELLRVQVELDQASQRPSETVADAARWVDLKHREEQLKTEHRPELLGALAEFPNASVIFRRGLPVTFSRAAHHTIGDDGAAALARCQELRTVTRLYLDHSGIGDRGAEALAGSPNLAAVTDLDLSGNPISARGARALMSSPVLTNLERLNLRGTDIDWWTRRALRAHFGERVLL
jgi:uncharacterized protein (TIGR02996 family)